MTTTTHYALPLIAEAQAQKFQTHNDALALIDTALHDVATGGADLGAGLDAIGATQGAILYRSGTAWTVLPPGTAGQVLQSGGAGANPSWSAGGGAVSSVNGQTGAVVLTIPTALSALTNDAGFITASALSGYATTTAVSAAINGLVNSAPGTLDTLGEIAAALAADESTAAALATTVAGKLAASDARVPPSPSGNGGLALRANAGGTALEYYTPTAYTLPTASTTTLGGVKVDGTSITISGGVISAPAASVTNPLTLTAATTIPAQVLAAGADTNVPLVLRPKGSGGILAAVPDSGITGGNARNTYSVDLQTDRNAADQVASGGGATISGGSRNKASGANTAVGGGQGNNATSQEATVSGGYGNTASNLRATIGGGNSNAASGGAATIAGGDGNTASGTNSAVGGGSSNTASNTSATVAGGATNAASQGYSTVGGGNNNSANGGTSWIPGGSYGNTRSTLSRGAWGAGRFATSGDAQAGEFVLRRQTTDATASALTADAAAAGASNGVILPNSGTYLVRALVTARQTGGAAGTAGDSAGWTVDCLVKRGASAAATSVVGGGGAAIAPAYSDAGAAGWRLAVAADTTNGALGLTGTGEASKNINWVARVLSAEAVG